jgi:hypothetical protein
VTPGVTEKGELGLMGNMANDVMTKRAGGLGGTVWDPECFGASNSDKQFAPTSNFGNWPVGASW